MAHENRGILSHVSIGTNDFRCAVRFYDLQHPGLAARGRELPEFTAIGGRPASVGNRTHVGFVAADKEQVHAFHRAALAAGAKDEDAPGPPPKYGPPYYGHKFEAAFWDPELVKKLCSDK